MTEWFTYIAGFLTPIVMILTIEYSGRLKRKWRAFRKRKWPEEHEWSALRDLVERGHWGSDYHRVVGQVAFEKLEQQYTSRFGWLW